MTSLYTPLAATGSFFGNFANKAFLSRMAVSVLRCTNFATGAVTELDFRSYFYSLSVAASVLKNFAM